MITRIGILSLLSGFFVFVFSGISSFMKADNFWINLTLSKMLGEENTEAIITWFETVMIQNALDFVFYDIPLFGILFIFGGVLLLISLFVKER